MRVIDVLELPSLRQAVVVSGRAGLGREVSSAMVLEAPDIENWGREGQLIITSFFALRDLGENGLENFFGTMGAIGISALIFKIERLVSEIPDEVKELSEQYGIPVIRVPKDTRYEPIMVEVLSNLINSNVRLLNRFYSVHRQTMALALTQPSVEDILFELKASIRAEVTFFNQTRDRKQGTSVPLANFSSMDIREFKERDPYQSFHYYDATLHYEGGDDRPATAIAVPSSDGQRYYLVIHQNGTRLSRLDSMVAENIASLLQMEVLKQNALDRQAYIKNNSLAHDLLLDRFQSLDTARHALAELGIDRFPNYQVVMIRVSLHEQSKGDRSDLERVITALRRAVTRISGASAYYENNERTLVIVNLPDGAPAISSEAVADVIRGVVKRGTMPSFHYLAAFSQIGSVHEISELNREVIAINHMFDDTLGKDRCVRYEDLGLLKMLLDLPDGVNAQQYLDPRVVMLLEAHPELLETLITFFRCGSNYQETAAKLYLHPKTVRYRVQQAYQLTGLDVKNPDDLMQIAFAGKMLEVMGPDL